MALQARPAHVSAKPLNLTIKRDVLHAQAFGAWLYVQLGSLGLFFGQRCRRGVRFVWNRPMPRVRYVRFYA